MLAGYIGTSQRFDDAIANFAADYADQTERDWQALLHSRRHATPTATIKQPLDADRHRSAKPASAASSTQVRKKKSRP
jgi:hypothetical protein